MDFLLYRPFHKDSPMELGTDLGQLFNITFLRDFIGYLDHLNANAPLKLTQKGNLPRKFCRELIELQIDEDGIMASSPYELQREEESYYITLLDQMSRNMGYTTKRKNKLTVSKKGMDFLGSDDVEKYHALFKYFVFTFNWGYSDRFANSWIMQGGFAYTLFLLQKYGEDWQRIGYYSNKYRIAFPHILADFQNHGLWTPLEAYEIAFELRVAERFLKRFGLAQVQQDRGMIREIHNMRKTAILDQLIKWKWDVFAFRKSEYSEQLKARYRKSRF